jgi:hypothetical protein
VIRGEIEEVGIRGVHKWFAPQSERILIHVKPPFLLGTTNMVQGKFIEYSNH